MKHVLRTALFIAGSFAFAQVYASAIPNDTTKVTTKVKRTAKKVGHKTAEIAVKGESAVVDKVYAGKAGPGGATVYINKNDHYYYVDSKGKKVFLKKSELHDKTKP